MGNKICKDCKLEKSKSEFYSHKKSRDRLSYFCKPCWLIRTKSFREQNPDKIKEINKSQYLKNREARIIRQKEWANSNKAKISDARKRRLNKNPEYNRKYTLKKHGITSEEFNKMLIGQHDKCWICSTVFVKKPDAKIDHCHKTGVIRGLLCSHCNTAIGLVKENITTLKIMIDYLKNNKDGWKEF